MLGSTVNVCFSKKFSMYRKSYQKEKNCSFPTEIALFLSYTSIGEHNRITRVQERLNLLIF